MEEKDKRERICYVCRRPESQTGTMISVTPQIDICPSCMERAFDTIRKSGMDISKLSGITPEMLWNGGLPPWMVTAPQKSRPSEPGQGNEEAGNARNADRTEQEGRGSEEHKTTGEFPEAGADQDAQPDADVEEKADTGEEADAGEDPDTGEAADTGDDTETEDDMFPWGQAFGIPIRAFDLNALMGKQRVRRKKEKREKKELFKLDEIPAPHVIKEQLDEYVIGQEQAKKVISVAVYNHYKRVYERTSPDAGKYGADIEIEKSNILMIGPTGSGKTYLVKTLAKLLHVPLAIADATSLTEAGYIGDDIESVISKLLTAADNDVERAQMGIVFIDEIDKIAKKPSTNTRDVSGEAVQQELLKLLEGTELEVPVGTNQKNAMTPTETVNTENILFICGGAFPDLENIIRERLMKHAAIGFGAELKDKSERDPELLKKVTNEDLRSFGMIPEFLGRLPVTVTLAGLTKEFLLRILTEPKNSILKQYHKLLAMDEVELSFDDDALAWIAEEALKKETGARALRAIIEEFMLDIMYEIPKDPEIGRVTITRAYLEQKGGPRIAMRGAQALPYPEP